MASIGQAAWLAEQLAMPQQASHVPAIQRQFDLGDAPRTGGSRGTLDWHALGNDRNLLEDMALSPAMGLHLSPLRNRREDLATGALPDEDFAREVMQLSSIGLVALDGNGTPGWTPAASRWRPTPTPT